MHINVVKAIIPADQEDLRRKISENYIESVGPLI